MGMFEHIRELEPYVDDAFKKFYDTMLNDAKLKVFFQNQEQIDMLILKQKEHFRASLSMDKATLKKSYTKLGEFHYDIRIPYIDFIKGTEILQEHFLVHAQEVVSDMHNVEDIFSYFKIIKEFTAKGYLNRMITEDRKDIDLILQQTQESDDSNFPKQIVLDKIVWLNDFLSVIEKNDDFNIETQKKLFSNTADFSKFINIKQKNIYEDIENRIFLDAQNLLYFLGKEEYLEILPLYMSLLNIYKLTLILNNMITIEYANNVIDYMKTDPLTGLFRKEIFNELAKKELSNLQRYTDRLFCLIYLDIDNFKEVNDNYGHYSGDKVIEKLGHLMTKNIRASDLGFRIGGDEFAIILKDSSIKNAQIVAKKIKAEFEDIEFKFNDDTTFQVTLSVGIVEQNINNITSFNELIKNVDEKLYFSKKNGKNQITV